MLVYSSLYGIIHGIHDSSYKKGYIIPFYELKITFYKGLTTFLGFTYVVMFILSNNHFLFLLLTLIGLLSYSFIHDSIYVFARKVLEHKKEGNFKSCISSSSATYSIRNKTKLILFTISIFLYTLILIFKLINI